MALVPTARGDAIDSSQLGFTLVTECVFLITNEINNNWPELSFNAVPEEQRIEDAVAKLKAAKQHGVDTIIDRVIPGIGRNVKRVKRVAERSPVNIIVATGYYTWSDLPYAIILQRAAPEELRKTVPTLEDLFVRDIEEGIAGTGVRAGIIKIVTDRWGLTDDVEYAIRASARAHRRTGSTITSHTGIGIGAKSGLLQQQVLADEGVDLSRVIIGHIDYTPDDELDDIQKIIDRGSYVAFDTVGLTQVYGNREPRIRRIVELCKRGHANRVLVSHDDQCYQDLFPESWLASEFPPYTRATRDLLPALRERGVTEDQIRQIVYDNPRRIFETRALGGY